jgi:hypothetical protein
LCQRVHFIVSDSPQNAVSLQKIRAKCAKAHAEPLFSLSVSTRFGLLQDMVFKQNLKGSRLDSIVRQCTKDSFGLVKNQRPNDVPRQYRE